MTEAEKLVKMFELGVIDEAELATALAERGLQMPTAAPEDDLFEWIED